MKFSQLNIGERFRYRQSVFTKSGPLQAVAENSGNTQLIPRSATVQIFREKPEAVPKIQTTEDRLREAVDLYHHECNEILRKTGAGKEEFDRLQKRYLNLLRLLERIESIS